MWYTVHKEWMDSLPSLSEKQEASPYHAGYSGGLPAGFLQGL